MARAVCIASGPAAALDLSEIIPGSEEVELTIFLAGKAFFVAGLAIATPLLTRRASDLAAPRRRMLSASAQRHPQEIGAKEEQMATIVESIEISRRPEDVFVSRRTFRISPNGRGASCRHAGKVTPH
jgi:hypothetical protein